MKEVISTVLEKFDAKWFMAFIQKDCLPNISKYMKAIPGDMKIIVERRLKEDYAKFQGQFNYAKFILVLKEYRPDLYNLAQSEVGERWFKAFWILIERYFKSLK